MPLIHPAKINASGANSSGKAAKDKINGSGGNLSGKAAQAYIDDKVNNDMITYVDDVCADAPSVSQLLGQARQGKKGKRKASKAVGIVINKAGYTATEVACGWAGAIFEVTKPFGQEQ